MFSNASNFVQDVDFTFAVILGISLVFLVGITGVMIYFIIKYNHKKNPVASNIKGNHTLEILWTVIPTILVMVMFYYGWAGYDKMRIVPEDAIKIKTTAKMWSWQFEYENGKITDSLVIPKDKAVTLDMMSEDVIHSLYIPAFRIKEDIIPGDTTFMWFIGQELGTYNILCAEYCGERHSFMITTLDVLEEADYNQWLNDTSKVDEHPGLSVLKVNACTACHSLDGNRIVGPSFKGMLGLKETIINSAGEEVEIVVDDAHIIKSIYEPNEDIVKSYNKNLMTSYKDKINEQQMQDILDYLKTIQ